LFLVYVYNIHILHILVKRKMENICK
jgi:hypothetical protein